VSNQQLKKLGSLPLCSLFDWIKGNFKTTPQANRPMIGFEGVAYEEKTGKHPELPDIHH
jgi:hypothetical protein